MTEQLPLAVRLRDEAGPPLPQMVAQRRAALQREEPPPWPRNDREWANGHVNSPLTTD